MLLLMLGIDRVIYFSASDQTVRNGAIRLCNQSKPGLHGEADLD